MNAINETLNDLAKNGADSLPGGYAIRVVNLFENRRKAALMMGGVLVLVGLAAWGGWYWQHKTSVRAPAAQGPATPISAPRAAPEQPAPSQPVAAVAPEAPQKEEAIQEEGAQKAAPLVPGINSESGLTPQASDLHAKPLAAKDSQSAPKAAKARLKAREAFAVSAGSADDHAGVQQTEPAAERKAPPAAAAPAHATGGKLDKRTKQVSVEQQADNEFRKAVALMQQGHINEALAGYEAALRLDAGHDAARQALVVLLLENKRIDDAERVLKEGLKNNLKHSWFAMVLARLQVERDTPWSALLTLQKTLPYASQQADYQAFVAALLQRLGRHKEAVTYYQKALQLSPNSGVWLMGQGISLQALQRKDEARDTFKRAIETHNLSEDLQAFVAQRLKEL